MINLSFYIQLVTKVNGNKNVSFPLNMNTFTAIRFRKGRKKQEGAYSSRLRKHILFNYVVYKDLRAPIEHGNPAAKAVTLISFSDLKRVIKYVRNINIFMTLSLLFHPDALCVL